MPMSLRSVDMSEAVHMEDAVDYLASSLAELSEESQRLLEERIYSASKMSNDVCLLKATIRLASESSSLTAEEVNRELDKIDKWIYPGVQPPVDRGFDCLTVREILGRDKEMTIDKLEQELVQDVLVSIGNWQKANRRLKEVNEEIERMKSYLSCAKSVRADVLDELRSQRPWNL